MSWTPQATLPLSAVEESEGFRLSQRADSEMVGRPNLV